jgi:GntR family transcriptional regulator, arabinose operon transcriptional repressor
MRTGDDKSDSTGDDRSGAPRYHAVTEALRREMAEGRLAAGVKLPALRELAEQYQVSTNTIRQAIRVLEREGCLYHVRDVGAFVHPSFPGKIGARISVALATINIGGALEMAIARGIEQACQQRGWELLIYDARLNPALEASNLGRLENSGTRGAIVMPISDHANLETLVKLKLAGYAMVLVDRGVPGLKVDLVESDHEKAGYLATEHLLCNGHDQVFMLTWPPLATSIAARIRGFERAMLKRGREPTRGNMIWIDPQMSARGVQESKPWLEGYQAVLPALRQHRGPMAIFALNDYVGWGVFEACRELGLRIPQDVSVICVDDSDITRALTPPMTVVAQRPDEIGRRAVELLERRLRAPGEHHEPAHEIVDVDLIRRQSVRCLTQLDQQTA